MLGSRVVLIYVSWRYLKSDVSHLIYDTVVCSKALQIWVYLNETIFYIISMTSLNRVRSTTFCHSKDEGSTPNQSLVVLFFKNRWRMNRKRWVSVGMESWRYPQRVKLTATGAVPGTKPTNDCLTHPNLSFGSRYPPKALNRPRKQQEFCHVPNS